MATTLETRDATLAYDDLVIAEGLTVGIPHGEPHGGHRPQCLRQVHPPEGSVAVADSPQGNRDA
ncbi:hypothetical protein GCM10025876_11490 [Demequina litorisediminis]|uniref:Uncharacterized protein n=1 Tax=Demequina litorisediminis TaxID=1849022 RepID=A0ABQ6IAX7_9MICO|nr:hypothetical protein [Demequina litorisediminis]GMA34945.1 hypothetical protein GCM10025876_11490 [Demequina litorisediminis]